MSLKPFGKISIKGIDSNLFKGGVEEKKSLAKSAGSTGFSQIKMKKELKNAGYSSAKREKIMGSVLGPNKPEKKKRRPIINRDRDTGAIGDLNRANISALGRVGNKARGFASSLGRGSKPVASPTSPPPPKPKAGPGQGLVNF